MFKYDIIDGVTNYRYFRMSKHNYYGLEMANMISQNIEFLLSNYTKGFHNTPQIIMVYKSFDIIFILSYLSYCILLYNCQSLWTTDLLKVYVITCESSIAQYCRLLSSLTVTCDLLAHSLQTILKTSTMVKIGCFANYYIKLWN